MTWRVSDAAFELEAPLRVKGSSLFVEHPGRTFPEFSDGSIKTTERLAGRAEDPGRRASPTVHFEQQDVS